MNEGSPEVLTDQKEIIAEGVKDLILGRDEKYLDAGQLAEALKSKFSGQELTQALACLSEEAGKAELISQIAKQYGSGSEFFEKEYKRLEEARNNFI